MMARDHKILGTFLAQRLMKNQSLAAKHLFLLGNVFPDKNPLTYLRGVYLGHPLKTHFISVSRLEIHRLCSKLENKRNFFLWDYYRLGALLHYVADAFTFPHNEHYPDGLLNHVMYEENILHPFFEKYMEQNNGIVLSDNTKPIPLKEVFEQMHLSYAKSEPSPSVDIEWTMKSCFTVCERILKRRLDL